MFIVIVIVMCVRVASMKAIKRTSMAAEDKNMFWPIFEPYVRAMCVTQRSGYVYMPLAY